MRAYSIPPCYCLAYVLLGPVGLNSILKIHENASRDASIEGWLQKEVVVEVVVEHYSNREADMPEALVVAVDDNYSAFVTDGKERQ